MISLFWTSGDICPGFQSQGGSLTCILPCLHKMYSSDSPLVCHLLTSSQPTLQISLFVHVLVQALVGVRGTVYALTNNLFRFYLSFYDFWIASKWIHLISWIQLILKNYLCVVLLMFYAKLWHLFTENNLLCIGKHYSRTLNFTFHT